MRYLPWAIQNALDNRKRLGESAALQYWRESMSQRQRNAVDRWIMKYRPDVLERFGTSPQCWRFTNLIEVLYAEYEDEKAASAEEAGA
jgi:hypothetical protein